MHTVSFESGGPPKKYPKILVVLDGPAPAAPSAGRFDALPSASCCVPRLRLRIEASVSLAAGEGAATPSDPNDMSAPPARRKGVVGGEPVKRSSWACLSRG